MVATAFRASAGSAIRLATTATRMIMVPRRFADPPPLSFALRSSLPSATHPSVDSTLKQLKLCTRRLEAAFASHRGELQVLERLYYKGKNQHRTAIFWRRVVEMRRYGDRLEGMAMFDLVDRLRCAFWGDLAQQNPKALKGPWCYFPDAKSVRFVVQRCYECCSLIDKIQERLSAAYSNFTLLMQTAAFLQLILTLAAIASRLRILLTEIRAATEQAGNACHKLLQSLSLTEAGKIQHPKGYGPHTAREIPLRTQSSTPSAEIAMSDDLVTEDLGSVLRRSNPEMDVAARDQSVDHPIDAISSSLELVRDDAQMDAFDMASATTVVTPRRITISRNPDKISSDSSRIATSAKRKQVETSKKSIKAKKKRKDDIDDIFGF
ncbi:uncharacterized protein FIBRA_01139 [Fibroporia radiculosa]|uniref:Nucleolus and neural progenitor protein-like N-terminal domain-containing protein n=1 Tax=Fibroporia radiculosa TaxID=599839 RepID=J4GJE4_9APHY|nr:uncharacterized protein FIBRA_01139 [Fibroporia radiculosa]CCL99125.1 predicted protein [Fibroporia radiculosa]